MLHDSGRGNFDPSREPGTARAGPVVERHGYRAGGNLIRCILVPLDGSAFGEQALAYAVPIARAAGARLHLIHVHRPAALETLGGLSPAETERDTMVLRAEGRYLDRVAESISEAAGGRVTASLIEGRVAEALQSTGEAEGVDLIVLATHGYGGLDRAWLGSTADRLIRSAVSPVLAVRPRNDRAGHEQAGPSAAFPFRRVLVPLDGSQLAERILGPATELARLGGSSLRLLRVISPRMLLDEVASVAGLPDTRNGIGHLADVARDYLEGIASRLGPDPATGPYRGVTVEYEVIENPRPAIAITDATEPGDLVALSTHGRVGLPRLLLGSIADKVLRSAPCPILIMRPE